MVFVYEDRPGFGGGHKSRCQLWYSQLGRGDLLGYSALSSLDLSPSNQPLILDIFHPDHKTVSYLDDLGYRVVCIDPPPTMDTSRCALVLGHLHPPAIYSRRKRTRGSNALVNQWLSLDHGPVSTEPSSLSQPPMAVINFGLDPEAQPPQKLFAQLIEAMDPPWQVVILGPKAESLSKQFSGHKRVRFLPLVPEDEFIRLQNRAQLIIGHFGLGTLRAHGRGLLVCCINPSNYHQKLTRLWGISGWLQSKFKPSQLRRYLRNQELRPKSLGSFNGVEFKELIQGQDLSRTIACPACHSHHRRNIWRNRSKSYYRCLDCTTEYLDPHGLTAMEYEDDYFAAEYRAQYGRSYQEDLPHITAMCDSRLGRAQRFIASAIRAPGDGTIWTLDIGCAFGASMAAARKRGWTAHGIDLSQRAVSYVNSQWPDTAAQISIGSEDWVSQVQKKFSSERYQLITMWYVIEHLPKLGMFLDQLYGLLEPGGVFALSTPNGLGITRRHKPHQFFEQSPKDHFTILNPRQLGTLLRERGFQVSLVHQTGIHPKRYPSILSQLPRPMIQGLAQSFGLGDTFELYAQRLH